MVGTVIPFFKASGTNPATQEYHNNILGSMVLSEDVDCLNVILNIPAAFLIQKLR